MGEERRKVKQWSGETLVGGEMGKRRRGEVGDVAESGSVDCLRQIVLCKKALRKETKEIYTYTYI